MDNKSYNNRKMLSYECHPLYGSLCRLDVQKSLLKKCHSIVVVRAKLRLN